MKVTGQEIIETLREMTVRHVSTYDLSALADRIQQHGIAVEYTPMTDDEWLKLRDDYQESEADEIFDLLAYVEQAVLARLGVAPNHTEQILDMVSDHTKAAKEVK
jgi:hypothetical protein